MDYESIARRIREGVDAIPKDHRHGARMSMSIDDAIEIACALESKSIAQPMPDDADETLREAQFLLAGIITDGTSADTDRARKSSYRLGQIRKALHEAHATEYQSVDRETFSELIGYALSEVYDKRKSEMAQSLGVARSQIERWRSGESHPLPKASRAVVRMILRDAITKNTEHQSVFDGKWQCAACHRWTPDAMTECGYCGDHRSSECKSIVRGGVS